MRKNKLLLLLALLMTAATGAWATDYTTLAAGDVIKVGDTFSPTDDGAINDWGVDNGKTYTLIRADIDNEYNVTEKTDGAYYVFKYVSIMSSPYIHFDKAFEVKAISDGLEVTNIKTVKGYLFYTLALHESAAAATYTVSLKDGVKDADKWTISPNPAEEGQTVTLKYTGRLKVKGVTATSDEKPAEATPALSITSPSVGQVIGSDGKNYAAASVPSGVTKVAMIAYVSGSNGLAIALADEGKLNWATAKSTCEAKTPAFTGGTWHLPSQAEWNQMFKANGGDEERCYGLNTKINTAGGTALLEGGTGYWTSTSNGSNVWYVWLMDGDTDWRSGNVNLAKQVRACLAF